jgi:hypothetical protein
MSQRCFMLKNQQLRGSRIVWLNFTANFSPIIRPFANRGLSRRLAWSDFGDERGNLNRG